MTTDSRSLIYLKPPTAIDPITPAILSQGWDVHVATDPGLAKKLMAENEFRVGMIQWDGSDEKSLQQRAKCLLDVNSKINCVALLSDVTDSVRRVSRVIANYFYDYHTLPLDVDRLLVTLGHAYGMAEIAHSHFEQQVEDPVTFAMVGRSPHMRALFHQINKIAAVDISVLIRGESGTGKELSAQAIHRLSSRSNGPFIAVNCGALPKDLIQTELFGHEKGSFTGASRHRVGRIEAAQGGTLFLDEVGDLPLDLQVNLLRFLQEKTINKVGSSSQIPVDVRVVSATNVNLEKAVEEGRFREDLYYRLNVLHLDMPPLRERGEDVELLAKHFVQKFAKSMNPNLKGFNQQAIEAVNRYPWPGNVREMINRIQRAVVMCEGKLIKPRDLGLDQDAPNSTLITLAEARAQAEKEAIEKTLSVMRNNVSNAAKRLGISRVTLYRLMELHSIDWQRSKNQ